MWGIPDWAIGIGVIIVAGSIGNALRLMLGGETGSRRRGRGRSELENTPVQGSEEVQRRLNELEERMDFAERLLAKQRDADRVNPPK